MECKRICLKCGVQSPVFTEDGKHNFCPSSEAFKGRIEEICMKCKMEEITAKWDSPPNKKESGMQGIEKTIFVLRDEELREAKLDEVQGNRIPPEALEVIVLKKDGTWTSFFPDPLGR